MQTHQPSEVRSITSASPYDSVELCAGSRLARLTSMLFTNVGPASGKGLALTNLTRPQKLDKPFVIDGFWLGYRDNVFAADLAHIVRAFRFTLIIDCEVFLNIPLGECFQAGIPRDSDFNDAAVHHVTPIELSPNQSLWAYLDGDPYTLEPSGSGLFYQAVLSGR